MISSSSRLTTRRWILPVGLMLIVAVAHSPALRNGFISDDHSLIEERIPLFESERGWQQVLTHSFWWGTSATGNKQDLYRPWVSLTYWIEYQIGGPSPAVYHVSNWLVHVANTGLAYAFLLPYLGIPLAFSATALAMLSPVGLTSVGWISGRTDLWALFFTLLFLLFFRHARAKRSLGLRVGAAASFFMALASKESAVFAPLIAWLFERMGPHEEPDGSPKRVDAVSYAVLMVPFGLYLALRSTTDAVLSAGSMVGSFMTSVPYIAEQYLRTVWHCLVPLHYDFCSELFWSMPNDRGVVFVLGWIIFALVAIVSFIAAWRRRIWAVGAVWFGLMLFPTYAFGQSFAPLADFYAYAGLPGLWLLVVERADSLLKGARNAPRRKALVTGLGVAAAAFAVLTFARQPTLKSELSLWSHMVQRQPRSVSALQALAEPHLAAGNVQQGLALLNRALEIDPQNRDVHLRLAAWHMDERNLDQARPHVEVLKAATPSTFQALVCVARYALETGQCAEAATTFHRASAYHIPTPDILFDFGRALLCVNDNESAAQVYRMALEQKPGWAEALNNLGVCYENLGSYDQAISTYETALRASPGMLVAWESLAIVYGKAGRLGDARRVAEQYARMNPPQERVDRLWSELGLQNAESSKDVSAPAR